jgi:hypothetical protein
VLRPAEGGLEPACAKSRPTDSIQFGELEERHARAHRRVETLHAKGVENAYLYGAPDATGGLQQLNALFLLTAAPETYNLPRAPSLASGLATILGGPLLIIDLHTPQRWYNVLRIFRETSPMSIGTWGLVSFGSLSAVLAAAQFASDHGHPPSRTKQRAIKLLEVPAALAGMAMSTYTGALLSATSTPVWAAAPRRIAALFGVSAMASGAAALTIAEQGRHVSEALGRSIASPSPPALSNCFSCCRCDSAFAKKEWRAP